MYKLRFYNNDGDLTHEEHFSTLEETAARWGAEYTPEKARNVLTPTAWESDDDGRNWTKIPDATVWEMSVGRKDAAEAEAENPNDLYTAILECLENMSAADLVRIHNNYCDAAGYPDNWIYFMSEFDEIMQGKSPWEVARSAYYSGNFCPAHDYFWFNGYGNLESDDFPHGGGSDPIYLDDIAKYIVDERDSLYDDDIQAILDDFDESED